jgi:hypothetical protein
MWNEERFEVPHIPLVQTEKTATRRQIIVHNIERPNINSIHLPLLKGERISCYVSEMNYPFT